MDWIAIIGEDKTNGNIWIGTNNGLTRIELATKKINHFTKTDGLHGKVPWRRVMLAGRGTRGRGSRSISGNGPLG